MTPIAEAGLTLTVDLGALARNWTRLARVAAPAECAAVVKADAYGLGVEHAVPALWAAGCRTFFVALPAEGRRARAAAPAAAIYVLGGFFAEAADTYAAADLRPVLNSAGDLSAWAKLGAGRPAALHVDTGMNRLGFSLPDALALAGSAEIGGAKIALLISHGGKLRALQITVSKLTARSNFSSMRSTKRATASLSMARTSRASSKVL